jgi:mannose-6-phosphate isomerase-like protein (cupin superfamily)
MRGKVNLADAFARFSDTWSPRIVAALNGQHVKVAKLEGEFDWHRHETEDELFLVVAGRLTLHLGGPEPTEIRLGEGELFVVPRGVEHKPVADGVAHVLLFEPASTLNTGTERTARTVDDPEWI